MKTLPLILAAGLCAGISAQQTLTVDPPTFDPAAAGLTYSQPGANFFDLIVDPLTGGITLHGLEIPSQEPAGTVGTIELWINTSMGGAPSSTHVGIEQLAAAPATTGDPSGWELLSSGAYTSAGFAVPAATCQSEFSVNFPGQFIPPGTWPMAIVYVDISHQFFGVTAYPAPLGTWNDGNIELTSGATQATAWTVATLTNFVFTGVTYPGCIPDFGVTYSTGLVPHSCAESEVVGVGSGANVASFFDLIEDAAPVSTALQGTSIELINNNDGYTVQAGTATYRAPSGLESSLTPIDDGEEMITLPNLSVPYPTDDGLGAMTTDLWIHSNGYISFTGPNSGLFFVPVDPQAAMNAPGQTLFATYHDFNSTEVGSGVITWEEDLAAVPSPTLYITWEGVESYPDTVANPSTIQVQIDLITGNIAVVYEIVDPVGGSTFAGGDDTLVGFSPAGPSPVVPETDLTTLPGSPFTLTMPEVLPLTLTPSGQPTLGAMVDLTTSNIPPGQPIGVTILDTTLVNPPTPLSIFGAPADAGLYVGALTFVFQVSDVAPMITVPVPVGTSVVGQELIAQSAWIDLFNLLGGGSIFTNLQTSNAVRLKIGIF